MSPPRISFGIPAYSRPALLKEAIASIRAQTLPLEWEIVVCDDLGLPGTAEVVLGFDDPRITLHVHPQRVGAVGNWNACLAVARGDWVMVLHEDDALFPEYLRLVAPLLAGDAVAVCTKTLTGGALPPAPAVPARPENRIYPPAWFVKSSMTPFPGVLMRREVAMRLGGFDAAWGPLADYEFWYRLACAGPVRVVDAVGAFYRQSPEQWTANAWEEMLQKVHLLRLRIARTHLPSRPLGKWFARFFSTRNARAYQTRFGGSARVLRRMRRLERIPLRFLPSGWVWRFLRAYAG